MNKKTKSPWTQEHISPSVGLVRQSCSEYHFDNVCLKSEGLWRIIIDLLEVVGEGLKLSFARPHLG